MSGLGEIGAKVFGVAQKLVAIDERFKRQEEDVRTLISEQSKLRDALYEMNSRITRLEEARNTTQAEVKMAMTEVLAKWETESLRRQLRDAQERMDGVARALPASVLDSE